MNNMAFRREATDNATVRASYLPSFDIRGLPGRPDIFALGVKGFLLPGWAGRLAAGLAQHGVSITRGEAEKVTVSLWNSTFELKSAPFAKDPRAIDYLTLANTEPPRDRAAERISLLDFRMEQRNEHEGSLYLELRGVDRLGFLGDLLDYFSMRCLFPVKMIVETAGTTALDRFWLKGVGGLRPSESISISIKENLERLVVG